MKKSVYRKLKRSCATQATSIVALSILWEKLFILKFSVRKKRIAGVQLDIGRL